MLTALATHTKINDNNNKDGRKLLEMTGIFMVLMVMIVSRMYIYTELYSLNMYSSLNVSHTSTKQIF